MAIIKHNINYYHLSFQNLECDEEKTSTNDDEERPVTRGEEEGMVDRSSHSDMSELRQELVKLLEGQGLEADVILQKLDTVLRAEQVTNSSACRDVDGHITCERFS